MWTFWPFDPGTWPRRVECQTIAPEPQFVGVTLLYWLLPQVQRLQSTQLVCVCKVKIINNAVVINFVRCRSLRKHNTIHFG